MKVLERWLPHGDYWPEGHPKAGAPTGPQEPDTLVVHAMAWSVIIDGETVYAATLLDRLRLSAHWLVAPDDDGTVIQCRREDQVAWHARGHNWNSIGLEVLVPGVTNYTEFLEAIAYPWMDRQSRQWENVIEIAAGALRRWDIPPEEPYLVRHSTLDPDRKTDPGRGFPWARFLDDVRGALRG